jgi:hypothetical protein
MAKRKPDKQTKIPVGLDRGESIPPFQQLTRTQPFSDYGHIQRPTIKKSDIAQAAVEGWHILPGTVVRRLMVGGVPQTDRILLTAGTGITITATRAVTPNDGNNAGTPRSTITISATNTVPNFADGELPSGVIDGVNTTFTLAHTPSPSRSLQVYLNGSYKYPAAVDYQLSGSTVVFVVAPPAAAHLTVFYRY